MLQISVRRFSPEVRSCGITRSRTRPRPSCPELRYSTRHLYIRLCIRRSPYVPIFDYLQTKVWTRSCTKLAPQSIITLVKIIDLDKLSHHIHAHTDVLGPHCLYYKTEEKRTFHLFVKCLFRYT